MENLLKQYLDYHPILGGSDNNIVLGYHLDGHNCTVSHQVVDMAWTKEKSTLNMWNVLEFVFEFNNKKN